MEHQPRLPGDWPVGQHRRASPALAGTDLELDLIWLPEIEIDTRIATTPPAHIAAGAHDPCGGPDIREDFHSVNGEWPRGEIVRWLLDTVRTHYLRADQ